MAEARISSVQCQRIFIACWAILGVTCGAAGTLALVRWQSERMAGADTRLFAEQSSRQIVGAIDPRRRTVVFLRDALDKTPSGAAVDRAALARSAVDHTPYWVGNGWIDRNKRFHWWVSPDPKSVESVDRFGQDIWRRIRMRDLLGLSSAFAVHPQGQGHAMFVVVEPFKARKSRPDRLVAVFDLNLMLDEALKPFSAQVLEGDRILYRSERWQPASEKGEKPAVVETPIRLDANRWILQAQRAESSLIPTRWFYLLVVLCAALAGISAAGMVWTAEHLRRLATTDELTGLYNRRFFFERWEEEVERAQRYNRDLSCLLVDLNGFKRVNDLLGHSKGDQLLRETASRLKAALRQSDLLARLGGDEFIVALPETDLVRASLVADKLRSLTIPAGMLRPLSLSVGVTQMRAGDSVHDIVQRADVDLYSGKGSAHKEGMVHVAG